MERDLSVRGGRHYTMDSVNAINGIYTVHGATTYAPFLLKPSGTAVMLSEMAPNAPSLDGSMRCV